MKGLILAAGKGSRLSKFTKDKPKCLIEIGDKSIFSHQVDALKENHIFDIIVVVGYRKKMIIDTSKKYKDINFTFIENSEFASTNTIYSLWLTKKILKNEDFIYLNGDVLFDPKVIKKLNIHKGVSLAIKKKTLYDGEEVRVRIKDGRILEISKEVPIDKSDGEFIGIAKFSKNFNPDFFEMAEGLIEKGNENAFFELALNNLTNSRNLYPVDVTNLLGIEIDFPDDLDKAKQLFTH